MQPHSVNLIKIGMVWRVTYAVDGEVRHAAYQIVDEACDFLVDQLGIEDSEVDNALIDMAVRGTTHAMFDGSKFSHSMNS